MNVQDDMSGVVAAMPGPWFVKPSRAGSSVGITKVKDIALLDDALRDALVHDDELLIEMAVPNPRELEVAVIGNLPVVTSSVVGEIIPGDEFYSYDDKYSENSTSQVIVGADLPREVAAQVKSTAEQMYKLLNCRGLARVDFLLSETGELYANEVNTMPGFTNISMFPKLMMESGFTYPQLIDKLIELALQ
jgi:D-alanine-D-alanine ligase